MASPILLKLLERRARKAGGYWDIRGPERFGIYKNSQPVSSVDDQQADFEVNAYRFQFRSPVWVHAVSLGETRASQPLVRLLLDQGYPVLLTHMTATGRDQGARSFAEDIGAGRLVQAWIPYDLPEAVEGFFAHWKPRCGILIEREVWPNLLRAAKKHQIPMVLASARFSDSALKQANLLGVVAREAYQSLHSILAQSQQDVERLQELGLNKIEIVGNLKFDVNISMNQVEMGRIAHAHLQRPIVTIASTRDGEENLFIEAILARQRQVDSDRKLALKEAQAHAPKQQVKVNRHCDTLTVTDTDISAIKKALYVIVPRHPERFSEVEALLRKSELNYVRRSDNPSDEQLMQADVLLGDTLGEMFFYYGLSDIAIVAGSFADFGGQNHIEACAVGVPVIVGPHTQNFAKYVEDAIVEGAARRVRHPIEAIVLAHSILEDAELLHNMGQAGKQWLALHQGVSQRIYRMIQPLLGNNHS
ncbi:MAG: 3-deoxy-D-manno-octulosonic acid transferase [Pelistega sp.]|nr:3-deoxy-D-manno-octulosonic acid transferase [Pelistega sp.]